MLESMINQIVQGDCLQIMKQIPDKSIDLILTDPPYGINYKSNRTDHHEFIENDNFDNWSGHLNNWLFEMARVLTDNGCCCCGGGGGGKTPVSALFTLEFIKYFNLIQTIVWDKKTIGLGWRYRPSYETIIIGSKSKDNYSFYADSRDVSNIVRIGNIIPQKGDHPTIKPVALMSFFIILHSKPDDIILDPFCGSGSTCVAAKQLNRRFIGIELSEKYCKIARSRLANVSPLLDYAEKQKQEQIEMF